LNTFVWTGDYGEYIVPKDVSKGIRFTKDGFPDLRSKEKAKGFMSWVIEQEEAARLELIQMGDKH